MVLSPGPGPATHLWGGWGLSPQTPGPHPTKPCTNSPTYPPSACPPPIAPQVPTRSHTPAAGALRPLTRTSGCGPSRQPLPTSRGAPASSGSSLSAPPSPGESQALPPLVTPARALRTLSPSLRLCSPHPAPNSGPQADPLPLSRARCHPGRLLLQLNPRAGRAQHGPEGSRGPAAGEPDLRPLTPQ